jgi:hypothetical protein
MHSTMNYVHAPESIARPAGGTDTFACARMLSIDGICGREILQSDYVTADESEQGAVSKGA